MATYSDFIQDILAEIPGAPYPYVLRVLKRTVRNFCKRTDVYQADLSDLSVISGTQEYTLSDPSDTEIIRLIKVQRAGTSDTRVYKKEYTEYFFDPPTLKLHEEPQENFTLEIRASLRPDETTTTVDDIIYDNYYEGIIAGTLYRMFRVKGTPWFDIDQANIYQKEYKGYILDARNDLEKQYTNRTLTIQMREFV